MMLVKRVPVEMGSDPTAACSNSSFCLFLLPRCWALRWTPSTLCSSPITQVGCVLRGPAVPCVCSCSFTSDTCSRFSVISVNAQKAQEEFTVQKAIGTFLSAECLYNGFSGRIVAAPKPPDFRWITPQPACHAGLRTVDSGIFSQPPVCPVICSCQKED